MARLTVEKIDIENRYEAILLAAYRAKNLEYGAKPLIDVDKEKKIKYALLALREMEAGKLDIEALRNNIGNQNESSIKTNELVKKEEGIDDATTEESVTHKESDSTDTHLVYEDE